MESSAEPAPPAPADSTSGDCDCETSDSISSSIALRLPPVIDTICTFIPAQDLLKFRLINRIWNDSCIALLKNHPEYSFIDLQPGAGEKWTEPDGHPLNDGCVRYQLFKYLTLEDLFKCRGVNHCWNRTSFFEIRGRIPDHPVVLKKDRILMYIKFLESRLDSVHWYAKDLKYMLDFGCGSGTQSAQLKYGYIKQLIAQFGRQCIKTVSASLDVGYPRKSSQTGCSDTTEHITDILAGTDLRKLELSLQCRNDFLHQHQQDHGIDPAAAQRQLIDCVPKILNSPHSIKELDLHSYAHAYGMPMIMIPGEFELEVARSLGQVDTKVLDSIEELKITNWSCPAWYDAVTPLKLKKLKHLTLNLDRGHHNYANDWFDFKNFVFRSCPVLKTCTFDLQLAFDLTRKEFRRQHEEAGINMEDSCPEIVFKILEYDDDGNEIGEEEEEEQAD